MENHWQGPSGSALATLLRERATALGLPVVVRVHSWQEPGAYGVEASWGADDVMLEVVDWSEAVRILDPGGDDVSLADALQYFELRATGSTPDEAFAGITPPRLSFLRRLRRWRLHLTLGACTACGHTWSEHPGDPRDPDLEWCGECDYEISHGLDAAPAAACRLARPTRPDWTT